VKAGHVASGRWSGRRQRILPLAWVVALAVGGCDTHLSAKAPNVNTHDSFTQAAERQRVAATIARLLKERADLLELQRQRNQQTLGGAARSGGNVSSPEGQSATSPEQSTGSVPSASFAQLQQRLGGSVGVVYSPLGRGSRPTSLGDWRSGPGWSTVKVPVAIASLTFLGDPPDSATSASLRLAITQSDNAAAERLWAGLGHPRTAAAKTQAILQAAGDNTTFVQSQRVRAGYSAFGQTTWSLTSQALFAAALPCLAHSASVLSLMGQVTTDQRWGIGAATANAQFKGGWGPTPSGRYLVRQMGVLTLPHGERIGLALAAEPADGRFATGVADASALARWVVANVHGIGAATC